MEYCGRDKEFERFDDHCDPLQMSTPFDRHLKLALNNEEQYTVVYLKVDDYKDKEKILLNGLKTDPACVNLKNHNGGKEGLDDHTRPIFSEIFHNLLFHPTHIFHTTDKHCNAVKLRINNLAKFRKNELITFISGVQKVLQRKKTVSHSDFLRIEQSKFYYDMKYLIKANIVVEKENGIFISPLQSTDNNNNMIQV